MPPAAPPSLRRATPDDAEAVAGVHARSWQWAYRGLVPDEALDALTPAARLPGWRRDLGPGTVHRVWLAEQAGRAVGFAAWGPSRDAGAEAGTAELYAIYLEADAAGTGVAGALLDAVAAELRGEGATRATLWVLADNPRARRFYERSGWTLDGAEKEVTLHGATLRAVRYAASLAARAGA